VPGSKFPIVPSYPHYSHQGQLAEGVHFSHTSARGRMELAVEGQFEIGRERVSGHAYRGTSLIRSPSPVGPHSSPVPRDLW